MHNPYAYTAAPAPASPEAQLTADYEAAIGPNTGYYLPRFEEFDKGGSRLGWHWPAFFVTSFWFMYRKMWLPGILNLIYPWVMLFILLIVVGVASKSFEANPVPFVLIGWLVLALPSFLLPMYANALYWRHVRNLIERLPNSVAAVPEKRMARLEREGQTGVGALIAVFAVGAFFFIGIIGVLAAIAIPAYQDYTIRSQVTEGLNLASVAKLSVADYWAEHGAWPEHADVMESTPSGMYTASVKVEGGSVIITYGGKANTNISGKRLAVMPAISAQGDVVWVCGNAEVPANVQPSGGPQGSEIPNKYLPKSCRPPS